MWLFARIKAREICLLLDRRPQTIGAKAACCTCLLIQRHDAGQHKTPARFTAAGDAAGEKAAALAAAHLSGWVAWGLIRCHYLSLRRHARTVNSEALRTRKLFSTMA
jgi:hypothetical protein